MNFFADILFFYCNYQLDKHKKNRKEKFAVNIHIGRWDVLEELSRVIPKRFHHFSHFNMLRYLKKIIKEVNFLRFI